MSADRKPIEPSEIRKGDLIRNEWDDGRAWEFRAQRDGDALGMVATNGLFSFIAGSSRHYLLDRPTPAVELPSRGNHLGWLTESLSGSPDRTLLVFNFDRSYGIEDTSFGSVPRSEVTAWTPATAVPTSALDELRAALKAHPGYMGNSINSKIAALEVLEAVRLFVAAIDEANL